MTDYGIDIASYQGTDIAWAAVRDHNITFCSVKLSEGTTYLNPAATAQVDGARSVGIAVGGYHYAHPGDPAGQAWFFADQLDARGLLAPGSLWPMLDMEQPGFSDPDGWIREFIAAFRQRTGAPLLVYANVYWLTSIIDPNEWVDEAVLLWAAQYNGNPGHPDYAHPRLAIHQHSNEGHVNGFPGLVDRNATVDGWNVSAFVLGNVQAPEPAPQPGPSQPSGWEDYTIVWGDTLSGIAAAHHTTVAELAAVNGIEDPDRIQAGQTIRVPAGGSGSGERYQIQPGDTLSALADRWGTTVWAIAARNRISNPDYIRAGDWLDRP